MCSCMCICLFACVRACFTIASRDGVGICGQEALGFGEHVWTLFFASLLPAPPTTWCCFRDGIAGLAFAFHDL